LLDLQKAARLKSDAKRHQPKIHDNNDNTIVEEPDPQQFHALDQGWLACKLRSSQQSSYSLQCMSALSAIDMFSLDHLGGTKMAQKLLKGRATEAHCRQSIMRAHT
jgi:hypothetical protein